MAYSRRTAAVRRKQAKKKKHICSTVDVRHTEEALDQKEASWINYGKWGVRSVYAVENVKLD